MACGYAAIVPRSFVLAKRIKNRFPTQLVGIIELSIFYLLESTIIFCNNETSFVNF